MSSPGESHPASHLPPRRGELPVAEHPEARKQPLAHLEAAERARVREPRAGELRVAPLDGHQVVEPRGYFPPRGIVGSTKVVYSPVLPTSDSVAAGDGGAAVDCGGVPVVAEGGGSVPAARWTPKARSMRPER